MPRAAETANVVRALAIHNSTLCNVVSAPKKDKTSKAKCEIEVICADAVERGRSGARTHEIP